MNIGPDVARALAQGARRAAPALVPTLAGPGAEASVDGGADAPVRGWPPGRPAARGKIPILRGKSGSWGTRADQVADQGVPTHLCKSSAPRHCSTGSVR
jgi:hypothetical protein